MFSFSFRHGPWLAFALLAASCIASVESAPADDEVGVLQVPLESFGSHGTIFRLAGTFQLAGPEPQTVTVSATDAQAGDDVLSLSPRVGSYMLTLSAWTLYEVDLATMLPTPRMDAALVGSPTQAVTIAVNQTTNVNYQFLVPGTGTINFARGALNVDFTVGEGYPNGTACMQAIECLSRVCTSGTCQVPSCTDGVQNGSEPGPDCGQECGVACPVTPCEETGCPAGRFCIDNDGDGQGDECLENCNPSVPTSCPAGLMCLFSASGDFVCGNIPGIGQPCGSNADCPNGLMCFADSMGGASCH